jgi:hypothetical protein
LIRFEWCSGEPEEPLHKESPQNKPTPTLLTSPDSQTQTPQFPGILSTSPTPSPIDFIQEPVDSFLPTDQDISDEAISRITEIGSTEAFHLVRSWPLSNGSGFDTRDLPYVHFFMNQMGNYVWFAGITSPVTRYIMTKATEEPVLRHAVLCTAAALLAERNITGYSRYYEHKAKTLALLRGHIDNMEINESVAAAVFFMLFVDVGEAPARSHLRGLKSVLDHLKRQGEAKSKGARDSEDSLNTKRGGLERYRGQEFNNPDITGVSPLAWLIWAWGIRMDIGLATVDGAPMIAPLPSGPEQETFHRSWISSLSDPSIPDSTDWGLANFTLDNIMHRGCHVARKARIIRKSQNYTPNDELKVYRLCQQVDDDLENWRMQPLLQRAKLEEDYQQSISGPVPPENCFLHYPPLVVYNRIYSNLMTDYRAAKLYLSLVRHPNPGPTPAGSGRFQHAVEICRVLAAKPLHERNDVRGAEEAMCLFLAGVVFGGDDYYPMESKWVQKAFQEYFPIYTGTTPEYLLGIWLENCPCVPMVREKNFPWTILSSIGVQSQFVELPQ